MIHKKKHSPSKRVISRKKSDGKKKENKLARRGGLRKVTTSVIEKVVFPQKRRVEIKKEEVFLQQNFHQSVFRQQQQQHHHQRSSSSSSHHYFEEVKIPTIKEEQVISGHDHFNQNNSSQQQLRNFQNLAPTMPSEEDDEEITDSMLDELDEFEDNIENNETFKFQSQIIPPPPPRKSPSKSEFNQKLIVPPPPPPKNELRPSVDAIMKYFGSSLFENSLSKFRFNVFQVKVQKERSVRFGAGHLYITFLKSMCWGNFQDSSNVIQEEPFRINIRFSKDRIISSNCTCCFEKCVHCCASVINLWLDDQVNWTAEKLYSSSKELKDLKLKFDDLQIKLKNSRDDEILEIQDNKKVTKKKKKKKKVSWRIPLKEFAESKSIPPPPPLVQKKKKNDLSENKSLSFLMNFNEGKALVPKEEEEEDRLTSKKRKRSDGNYDGIPEKDENVKKRKL